MYWKSINMFVHFAFSYMVTCLIPKHSEWSNVWPCDLKETSEKFSEMFQIELQCDSDSESVSI